MAEEVATWMECHKLVKYTERLMEDIDSLDDISILTPADVAEIISGWKVAARRKFLLAVKDLKATRGDVPEDESLHAPALGDTPSDAHAVVPVVGVSSLEHTKTVLKVEDSIENRDVRVENARAAGGSGDGSVRAGGSGHGSGDDSRHGSGRGSNQGHGEGSLGGDHDTDGSDANEGDNGDGSGDSGNSGDGDDSECHPGADNSVDGAEVDANLSGRQGNRSADKSDDAVDVAGNPNADQCNPRAGDNDEENGLVKTEGDCAGLGETDEEDVEVDAKEVDNEAQENEASEQDEAETDDEDDDAADHCQDFVLIVKGNDEATGSADQPKENKKKKLSKAALKAKRQREKTAKRLQDAVDKAKAKAAKVAAQKEQQKFGRKLPKRVKGPDKDIEARLARDIEKFKKKGERRAAPSLARKVSVASLPATPLRSPRKASVQVRHLKSMEKFKARGKARLVKTEKLIEEPVMKALPAVNGHTLDAAAQARIDRDIAKAKAKAEARKHKEEQLKLEEQKREQEMLERHRRVSASPITDARMLAQREAEIVKAKQKREQIELKKRQAQEQEDMALRRLEHVKVTQEPEEVLEQREAEMDAARLKAQRKRARVKAKQLAQAGLGGGIPRAPRKVRLSIRKSSRPTPVRKVSSEGKGQEQAVSPPPVARSSSPPLATSPAVETTRADEPVAPRPYGAHSIEALEREQAANERPRFDPPDTSTARSGDSPSTRRVTEEAMPRKLSTEAKSKLGRTRNKSTDTKPSHARQRRSSSGDYGPTLEASAPDCDMCGMTKAVIWCGDCQLALCIDNQCNEDQHKSASKWHHVKRRYRVRDRKFAQMVVCYLCGQQFSFQSLSIHFDSCKVKRKLLFRDLPSALRPKALPRAPTLPIPTQESSHGEYKLFNTEATEAYKEYSMITCPHKGCNRRFEPDSAVKHVDNCQHKVR